MSNSVDFDEETSRRSYGRPYTSKHPVPTIQGYREQRAELKERLRETEDEQNRQDGGEDSKLKRAYESVKTIAKGDDTKKSAHEPYPTSNRNDGHRPMRENVNQAPLHRDTAEKKSGGAGEGDGKDRDEQGRTATEAAAGHVDPKEKRQAMKKIKRSGGGREVTDPVTHLPVVIHDRTDKDLEDAPENEPSAGSLPRTSTGISGASKTKSQHDLEQAEMQRGYNGMQKLFPPPDLYDTRDELKRTYKLAMTVGLGAIVAIAFVALVIIQSIGVFFSGPVTHDGPWYHPNSVTSQRSFRWIGPGLVIVLAGLAGATLVVSVSGWLSNRVNDIWDDETWDAARQEEVGFNDSESELPESVAWLNGLLASVWPLINPDLFASLVDTLEDVMQASLPRVIRMVSIDDLGQGSESIRILGIRWLPTGAASQSVDADGKLKKPTENKESDRTNPGEGQIQDGDADEKTDDNQGVREKPEAKREKEEQRKERKQEQEAIREGMEAEEGDFVNMELAFAYRARSSGKSLRAKVKNAHLYLKFYLPGGIAVPVWVELRGIIGTMRLRLQLSPDPPFFNLCTLTFLGQPRANLSCVPLSKHSLNIMDVPFISSFVQSAIDAALAEYVAPKSLTLDLKDMLVGDDFKKDTVARGAVLVYIKRARNFKEGDGGIGPMRGSSDSYVTVSWGKFGKPAASTRIIVNTQEPEWHEWASILVTPDELNAEEKLRVQLWDSDKFTADDDLGRVEVDLKQLMHNPDTHNKMCDREDDFKGEDPDETMPGSLTWSVGYFAKARIQECQLEKQKVYPEIQTKDALKKAVSKTAKSKLREATVKDEDKELRQQMAQDYKEREDEMMVSTPPPDGLPSGIFSIQIHNVVGLEIQRLNRESKGADNADREDEAEQSDNLPDSYATIILNHRKIYRTRTKPKNAKPFFNAGTERFVKDWRSAEVMISVRDAREREDDALLGVIYLPLGKVFQKTSQVMSTYPLAGGIGYGKARISMVWRSVELKMPKELLGWDYGTLEVKPPVMAKGGGEMMEQLKDYRIKLKTNLGKVKMQPSGTHTFRSNQETTSGRPEWRPRGKAQEESVFLALRKRYASSLIIEFRKSTIGPDSTPAFAVFWPSELVDEEEKTVTLKVWKGGKDNLERARTCCDYNGIDENEQPVGEIEVTLKFWRGLSGYHKQYAEKARNNDVRNVMEVLDTINDEKMAEDHEDDDDQSSDSDADTKDSEFSVESKGSDNPNSGSGTGPKSPSADAETKRKLRVNTNQNDSDSDSGSESGLSALKNPIKTIKKKANGLADGHEDEDGEDDGTRGLRGQVQDYKAHHKQLHRKHRGVMQWKSARSLDWLVGKAKRGKGRVEGIFEHGDKDQGVETEV